MWEQKKVPTGHFRVSTPEMTAYDLLALPRACPSLDRVATIYVELGESLRADALAALCDLDSETAILQRLGWLLDHTGWNKVTGGLAVKLQDRRVDWLLLQTRLPPRAARNEKWHIIENTDVQPDI